jgi:hypothetical protein
MAGKPGSAEAVVDEPGSAEAVVDEPAAVRPVAWSLRIMFIIRPQLTPLREKSSFLRNGKCSTGKISRLRL